MNMDSHDAADANRGLFVLLDGSLGSASDLAEACLDLWDGQSLAAQSVMLRLVARRVEDRRQSNQLRGIADAIDHLVRILNWAAKRPAEVSSLTEQSGVVLVEALAKRGDAWGHAAEMGRVALARGREGLASIIVSSEGDSPDAPA